MSLSSLSTSGSWLVGSVGSGLQAVNERVRGPVPEETTSFPQGYKDLESRINDLDRIHSSLLKYGLPSISKCFENEPSDYSTQIQESVAGLSTSVTQGIRNISPLNRYANKPDAQAPSPSPPAQSKSLPHALGKSATAAATAMQGAQAPTEVHLWKALSAYAKVWDGIDTARVRQDKDAKQSWQTTLSTSIAMARKACEVADNSRRRVDIARSALKSAEGQEQAQSDVTKAETEFMQKAKDAIAVMGIVLDNPEPIQKLNELLKTQCLYFASAAELLAPVQHQLEEISICAEADYRTALLSDPLSQATISPIDQRLVASRKYLGIPELEQTVQRSSQAQKNWRRYPLQGRIGIGMKFMEELKKMAFELSSELTRQNGQPIKQVEVEIRDSILRGQSLLSSAESNLADKTEDTGQSGYRRLIKRDPLGIVLVVSPWTFPYLITIESIIPAIVAGNAVILKPSSQTPLVAERLVMAMERAGAPKDILQVVHLTPSSTAHVAQRVDFVCSTGNHVGDQVDEIAALDLTTVQGHIQRLDGKNPAYVRADADIRYAVAELVEASMFNSGQHSSSVERIYVHEDVYDRFVTQFVDLVKVYKLGNPSIPETTLGPVISIASAQRIRKQIAEAVEAGAKALVPEGLFPIASEYNAYVVPQVLVDVDHSMTVMKDVTFGPVVGIQKVASDDEAISLMNDTCYSFTASLWTNTHANPESESSFQRITDSLNATAVFLNRCDRLDPWTNTNHTNQSQSQGSSVGYEMFTRTTCVNIKAS